MFCLGAAGLALLVVGAYFPALSTGFIWDDLAFTSAAPIAEPSGIWRIWFSPAEIEGEGHYWPLTYTTFWLEHQLWGSFWAPGFHATNLLLHCANAVLVWHLLRRLGALPVWWAWAVAALFAVHPVHAEAVVWVIGRKDLLATLFYLGTALAWLRAWQEPAATSWYGIALLLFAAGLLCKSIGITLPIALLLHAWWQNGRLTLNDGWRVAPFFLVAFGIGIGDMRYYEEVIDVDYTFIERAQIAAHSLWFYLGKLLWPVDLMPIYPHWRVDVAAVVPWIYTLCAIAVAATAWLLRRKLRRGAFAGAGFFVLTLSPTLGLVPFGYMQFAFVANRYQYLADVGALAVVVGAAALAFRAYAGTMRWPAVAVASALLVVLGVHSWRYAGIYQDDIVFFRHVIASNPQARDAHYNLGSALFRAGEREEGLALTQASLALRPGSMKAQYGAGMMLHQLGRPEEALGHLRSALAINANNSIVQHATGEVLMALGRGGEAQEHFRRTLAVEPRHWAARVNLARLLVNTGRADEAARHLREAMTIRPDRIDTLLLLANIEFNRQRYNEALEAYRRVVDALPNNAQAWSGMAAALYHLGRPSEALRHVDRALALDPSLQEARNNRVAIAAAGEAAEAAAVEQ